MKILFNVKCECGYEFETGKIENIQCRECGRRFDLDQPENIPPLCPICGGIIIGKIGTSKIVCNDCAKEWDLV